MREGVFNVTMCDEKAVGNTVTHFVNTVHCVTVRTVCVTVTVRVTFTAIALVDVKKTV